jgi:hypothetical protein
LGCAGLEDFFQFFVDAEAGGAVCELAEQGGGELSVIACQLGRRIVCD